MTDAMKSLIIEFEKNSNKSVAAAQKKYLRSQFEFYGIKTPLRRQLQKPFLSKSNLPPKIQLESIVKELWNKRERECHYFAQELVEKYIFEFDESDIHLLEYMITHQSWWDTVDYISTKLVGPFFKKYPDRIIPFTTKWVESKNIWLQRTSILFQLHYKSSVDTDILSSVIHSLSGSQEFFINKAIGWMLRQYSRTNPKWVINFVRNAHLDKLSRREALKNLRK
jgi:3-methyladenine DNA glycosylase AlkD